MGLFWDSPEEKHAKAIQAAQTIVVQCFDAHDAQANLVALRRKSYESKKLAHQEAEKMFQSTSALYVATINTMPKGSKELTDAQVNFALREDQVKNAWAEMSQARRALDTAVSELIQKANQKLEAERKLEQLIRPNVEASQKSVERAAPTTSKKMTIQDEYAKYYEQSKLNKESVLTGFGKLYVPSNLENQIFRKSPSTPVSKDVSVCHDTVNFKEMHEKLNKLLVPVTPKSPVVDLWKELPFNNEQLKSHGESEPEVKIKINPEVEVSPDLQAWQQLPFPPASDFELKRQQLSHLFCTAYDCHHDKKNLAPKIDPDLKAKIQGLRKLHTS